MIRTPFQFLLFQSSQHLKQCADELSTNTTSLWVIWDGPRFVDAIWFKQCPGRLPAVIGSMLSSCLLTSGSVFTQAARNVTPLVWSSRASRCYWGSLRLLGPAMPHVHPPARSEVAVLLCGHLSS